MKKGIIFDLDGTLWDSSKAVVDSWNVKIREFEDVDYEMTYEQMQGYMGMPMDEIAYAFFDKVSKERALELAAICMEYENEYIAQYGGELMPGLEEGLQSLRDEGYCLYIVSNCQEGYIEAFLKYHKLGQYFDDTENFGKTGLQKDGNIRLIVERNSLDQAVYVGDILADYNSTMKAGLPFIHAAYGFGHVPEGTIKVQAFSELNEAVKIAFGEIPSDTQATDKAKELLSYLRNVAGKQIITGQHTQTNPMEERAYIHEVTGHYPKLVEFEMLSYSPNINFEDASEACLTEIYENQDTMKTALALVKEQDVIPMFCFHWFSPIGGRDKAFYTEHTEFDPERILVEGSDERDAFYADMDVIARELKVFGDAGIPIIWRPFHEVEGTWFWWGSKGGEVAAKLYRMMYDYFVNEKQLHHMLWAWSCPTKEGYPGDAVVDIVGWDIYLPEKISTDYKEKYEELVANTSIYKVAAITEVGYNPDVEKLTKSHVPWAFYMTWSKEFAMDGVINTKEELKSMYDNEYSIKL